MYSWGFEPECVGASRLRVAPERDVSGTLEALLVAPPRYPQAPCVCDLDTESRQNFCRISGPGGWCDRLGVFQTWNVPKTPLVTVIIIESFTFYHKSKQFLTQDLV